jgi:hypothetical protein
LETIGKNLPAGAVYIEKVLWEYGIVVLSKPRDIIFPTDCYSIINVKTGIFGFDVFWNIGSLEVLLFCGWVNTALTDARVSKKYRIIRSPLSTLYHLRVLGIYGGADAPKLWGSNDWNSRYIPYPNLFLLAGRRFNFTKLARYAIDSFEIGIGPRSRK